MVPFRLLCQICLALPLAGLVACLLMAVVFQFGDIQETACQVSTLNDDLNLGTWYIMLECWKYSAVQMNVVKGCVT